jgi:predicted O-methyltransferase YrrM
MTKAHKVIIPLKLRLLARASEIIRKTSSENKCQRKNIIMLALAWGNPGYAASISYLLSICERVRQTHGPILECGSGVSTILIAALTSTRKTPYVVLEHDRKWYEHLKVILDTLGFQHVRLVHAPLQNFGYYDWYRVPADQIADDIRLVICDGPPGKIDGGRYGLMPRMENHLADDCVILLDDAHREGERQVLDAWKDYRCLRTNRLGHFGRHAEVFCC